MRTTTTYTDGTASNGSVTLATRDYGGNGPDLLYLPGGGQNLVDCDLLAPYWTPHFRVVAMDVRGHGFSSAAPFTFEGALEDIDAVTSALGMVDTAVVGHSLGGMVAALHGAHHPGSLGVVNVDGHGGGKPHQYDGVDEEVTAARFAEMAELRGAQIAAMQAAGDQVQPAAMLDVAIAQYQDVYGLDAEFAREALLRNWVAVEGGYQRRSRTEQLLQIHERVEELDFAAMYRACKAPLLVYNAVAPLRLAAGQPEFLVEHMAAYRRGLSKELAALSEEIPTMSWIEIDASHGLNYEQPELVATQIRDFLTAS